MRLVLGPRAALRFAAHKVEAVGVPVVPVVAAAFDVEPAPARRTAMAGRPGRQVRSRSDELIALAVVLPFRDAGPHLFVVRPEVLIAHHECGVRSVKLAPAAGALAEGVG